MKFVSDLVQRNGWSTVERDRQIERELGYPRDYSKLSKSEASELIDAWQQVTPATGTSKPVAVSPDTRFTPPRSGDPATEKQLKFVSDLSRQKGWSDLERDAQIQRVLGYPRKYADLTKDEASQVIDAWHSKR